MGLPDGHKVTAGFLDRPLLIAAFSSFQLQSKQKLRPAAPQAPACPAAGAQRGHLHRCPRGGCDWPSCYVRERESNRLARSVPWLAPLISVCMLAFEYESRESNSQEPSHHLCHGKSKQDARSRGGCGGLLRLAGCIRAPCWPTCAGRHGGRRRGHAGHSAGLRGQDRRCGQGSIREVVPILEGLLSMITGPSWLERSFL